jgi:hypothetical protein
MDVIKKYKVVIVIVLPILILILIHSIGSYHFKSDAKKWAEPSVMRSNIITSDMTTKLPGDKIIFNLDGSGKETNKVLGVSINIPSDSILSKKYISIIRNHTGSVLLFSTNTTVSARVWMILSQMGYRNIYILTDNADNEVLKYKFRPDTLVKPEL